MTDGVMTETEAEEFAERQPATDRATAARLANDKCRLPLHEWGYAEYEAHAIWCKKVCTFLRTLAAQPDDAAAGEREACAKLADAHAMGATHQRNAKRALADLAENIRARTAVPAQPAYAADKCPHDWMRHFREDEITVNWRKCRMCGDEEILP